MLPNVNTTLMLKLVPSEEQARSLLATMEAFNAGCNFVAGIAFENHTASKYRLQPLCYHELRQRFGLSAQMTVRCIGKVADTYKRDKKIKPVFKPHGAVVYDQRILSFKGLDTASILTLEGRVKVPLVMYGYAADRIALYGLRGQADLLYHDGEFYLAVVVNIPEPPPEDPKDFLGVDFGIVNLATDSDGEVHTGAQVNGLRHRHRRLRRKLQRKGTKSAKRLLKTRRRKEERFGRDVNHGISKHLVAKAQDTGRGLALEDLEGIADRVTVRRRQRATLHSWSFYQLGSFVEYKARIAGVPFVKVDPRNTSRTCPTCGAIDKRNRPSQARFSCVSCGFAGLADHIAAVNIANVARRVAVSQPNVSGLCAQGQATGLQPQW